MYTISKYYAIYHPDTKTDTLISILLGLVFGSAIIALFVMYGKSYQLYICRWFEIYSSIAKNTVYSYTWSKRWAKRNLKHCGIFLNH